MEDRDVKEVQEREMFDIIPPTWRPNSISSGKENEILRLGGGGEGETTGAREGGGKYLFLSRVIIIFHIRAK